MTLEYLNLPHQVKPFAFIKKRRHPKRIESEKYLRRNKQPHYPFRFDEKETTNWLPENLRQPIHRKYNESQKTLLIIMFVPDSLHILRKKQGNIMLQSPVDTTLKRLRLENVENPSLTVSFRTFLSSGTKFRVHISTA